MYHHPFCHLYIGGHVHRKHSLYKMFTHNHSSLLRNKCVYACTYICVCKSVCVCMCICGCIKLIEYLITGCVLNY